MTMQKHNVDSNQNLESSHCVTKLHHKQIYVKKNVEQLKTIMLLWVLVMFLPYKCSNYRMTS